MWWNRERHICLVKSEQCLPLIFLQLQWVTTLARACRCVPWATDPSIGHCSRTSVRWLSPPTLPLPCFPPFIHYQSAACYLTYFFFFSILLRSLQAIKTTGHPQVGVKRVGIRGVALSRNEPDFAPHGDTVSFMLPPFSSCYFVFLYLQVAASSPINTDQL